MRTIITLVIVVIVLNATTRGGTAAWKYYQLKDAAQEIVVFGAFTPTSELQQQVLDKAYKLEIPMTANQVNVMRDGQRTVIEASYIQPVEFFPRYEYPISFRFMVEGLYVGGGPVTPRR